MQSYSSKNPLYINKRSNNKGRDLDRRKSKKAVHILINNHRSNKIRKEKRTSKKKATDQNKKKKVNNQNPNNKS